MSSPILRAYWLPLSLIIAMIAGTLVGSAVGEPAKGLEPFGDVFINLLFITISPLIFFSIGSAIIRTGSLRKLGRVFGIMLIVFTVLGALAALITIGVLGVTGPLVKPGEISLPGAPEVKPPSVSEMIVSTFTRRQFYALFDPKAVLPLIVFTVIFSIAILRAGEEVAKKVSTLFELFANILYEVIKIIMIYGIFGIFAYFATLSASLGVQLIGVYGRIFAIYTALAIGYWAAVYSIIAYASGGTRALKAWWSNVLYPAVVALGTCSSVATIPAELEAARRAGVPKDIRDLVIPIGATIHMDGTAISGIVKIAFLFSLFNMNFFVPGNIAAAVAIAVLNAVVMAGVPGGGYAGELFIISVYGFPLEAFPLIAMIGTIIDAPATMINSTGDFAASMLIARLVYGKEWWRHGD
jgi:Na+/H+-dicarboxylate symporter